MVERQISGYRAATPVVSDLADALESAATALRQSNADNVRAALQELVALQVCAGQTELGLVEATADLLRQSLHYLTIALPMAVVESPGALGPPKVPREEQITKKEIPCILPHRGKDTIPDTLLHPNKTTAQDMERVQDVMRKYLRDLEQEEDE